MTEQIRDSAAKQQIAREVLESLREWFEVDASREQYIAESACQIMLAEKEAGAYAGFLCIKETGNATAEIAVMGVRKEYHRRGIGRRLVERAKQIAAAAGYSFLQVKTVQSGYYPDYDLTNLFYISCGFKEFEVIPAVWGPENPCQIYVMALDSIPVSEA